MKIAVFMSLGTSLADWDRQGILDREVVVYRLLADRYGHQVFLCVPDGAIHPDLCARIHPVVPLLNRWRLGGLVYSFLAPILHWRILRQCQVVRSHNARGLWTPLLAKLLCCTRLTVRFGYIWSWDAVRRGVSGWKLWIVLASEWLACRQADVISVSTEQQAKYLKIVHGIGRD